ncbi:DUF2207 domain-containing protein [Microbacterium sp. MC2]
MRRFLRVLAVAAIGILAFLILAAPAAADVDDFTFDSLTVDYTLTRADDGTSRLQVVEEFVARFPDADQNRGMRRTIPDTYNRQPLHPRLVSITDGDGNPRPAETDAQDGSFSMTSRADDYVHGVQTYVFTYTLENVTWHFDDTGLEFYWDVNGVDWAQPFGEVTARVHLDAALADQLSGRWACYAGVQGSTSSCTSADVAPAEAGGVTLTATQAGLAPHETLTVAVGFADDTFTLFDTAYLAAAAGWVQLAGGAGALGAAGLAVWSRRKYLRDEPGRPTIIAEYTPPPGIDALESAVLLHKTGKAIPAEVLEQAVVGSIRIIEGPKKFGGGHKLIAELVDPSRADGDGRMLLDGLFPSGMPGEQYTFGSQDQRLSTAAQKILKEARRALKDRGLYRPVPPVARALPFAVAIVAGIVVLAAGIIALDSGVDSPWPVLLIVGFGAVLVFLSIMLLRSPLTVAGAEVRDHLRGLQEFIEWAEADRIRMLQSPEGAERMPVDTGDPRQMLRLYESLLPYAVVFGQEKEWSQQLAVLYTATGAAGPAWYDGAGSFNAASFSAGIGSLSAAATSSSSTSGGSAGGGSAGGGGGGGGGGGV